MKPLILQHSVSGQNILFRIPIRLSEELMRGSISMVESEIINKAIEYIFAHINEKLTVDEVAQHCHMSKYHFSRLFKQEVGESLYSFIKHNRIALSAVNLKVNKEQAVTDVGLDCGYSASNYATVFKEQLKLSPVQFRQKRCWSDGKIPHPFLDVEFGCLKSFEEYDGCITIMQLPERKICYRRFIGSYIDLKDHWIQFMADNEKYVTEETLWIERSFSDPDIMELDRCICDVGMTVTERVEKQMDADASKEMLLQSKSTIPGGQYAVYHFQGHRNDIYTTYQGLFTVWLPQSGCELRCGDLYDVIYRADSETDMLEMDVCIPIV